MKIITTFMVGLLLFFTAEAQHDSRSFTLEQITDSALRNYPLLAQRNLFSQQTQLNRENIDKTWLPTFQLSGQASYQSEVTHLNLSLPGFSAPVMAQDWYKLNVDLTQVLYDGGSHKNQMAVEEVNLQAQLNSVTQHEFHFKENITRLYFRALLFERNITALQSGATALEASMREMKSALDQGTILQADVNALKAEWFSVGQKITEAESARQATLRMLTVFTGIELQTSDRLVVPKTEVVCSWHGQLRPEYMQLNLQQSKLEKMKSLLSVRNRPIVMAYGQLGYGRPGLNMLDDGFTGYYIAGIRFSYKFWDWNTNRREKQIIGIQQQVLETEKQNFENNLKAGFDSQSEEILKLKQFIQSDEQIIILQQTVVDAALKRMKSGMITTAQYIQELEKLTRSKVNLETNRIKLMNATYESMFLTGKLIENE